MPKDIVPPHPRERYKHFRDPKIRENSFRKWPDKLKAQIEELVDDGFFSVDDDARRVQCVYCGGVLTGIKENDNVHVRHYRHFSHCERFKWRERNFAALFKSIVNTNTLCEITVADGDKHPCASSSIIGSKNDEKDSSNPYYITGENRFPRHPYYALYIDRLRTYKNWPKHLNHQPDELARAGLFYTGVGDVCECYCCGGQLEDWDPDDKPQEEHDAWFPDICPLYQTRNRQF